LCQALGISIEHNGADLVSGDRGVRILDDGMGPPDEPGVTVRIGLTKGAEHPWRYFVPGDRHVSGRLGALSRGATREGRNGDTPPDAVFRRSRALIAASLL
jgi:hypothetical protein